MNEWMIIGDPSSSITHHIMGPTIRCVYLLCKRLSMSRHKENLAMLVVYFRFYLLDVMRYVMWALCVRVVWCMAWFEGENRSTLKQKMCVSMGFGPGDMFNDVNDWCLGQTIWLFQWERLIFTSSSSSLSSSSSSEWHSPWFAIVEWHEMVPSESIQRVKLHV